MRCLSNNRRYALMDRRSKIEDRSAARTRSGGFRRRLGHRSPDREAGFTYRDYADVGVFLSAFGFLCSRLPLFWTFDPALTRVCLNIALAARPLAS